MGHEEDDLDAMLDELGVDVVVEGNPGKGLVNRTDESAVPGAETEIVASRLVVLVRTGFFEGLQSGGKITVAGIEYLIDNLQRRGSGVETLVECTHLDQ